MKAGGRGRMLQILIECLETTLSVTCQKKKKMPTRSLKVIFLL